MSGESADDPPHAGAERQPAGTGGASPHYIQNASHTPILLESIA